MKEYIVLVFLAVSSALPVFAGEIVVERIALPSWTIHPGQKDVAVIGVKAVNTGTETDAIMSVTVTFPLQAGAIAPGSVRLWNDADGNWATSTDRVQTGSSAGITGTKAVFTDPAIVLAPGAAGYFFVSADIATSVHYADKVFGEISAPGDMLSSSGTISGTFPLTSLDGAVPHCVDIEASALRLELSSPRAVAGEPLSFTVSCVDAYGNVDEGWTGSAVSITGTPGSAPGKSDSGKSPVYKGGGAWTPEDKGKRTCSCTLYRIESDRKIRAADTVLGFADSELLLVHAGPAARMTIAPIGDQTAGVPFDVTVSALSNSGDPAAGYTGSAVTVGEEHDAGPSAGGFPAAFPPASPWSGGEEQGRKKFTVVLYAAGVQAALRASDPLLGNAVSNDFLVRPSSPAAFMLDGTGVLMQGTTEVITITTKDVWGNVPSNYCGHVSLACSDMQAAFPAAATFSGGTASVRALMNSPGLNTVTVTCTEYPALGGALALTVTDAAVLVNRFRLTAPVSVRPGVGFQADITALDKEGGVVGGYGGDVNISVSPSGVVSPSTVQLVHGAWAGVLTIAAFAPEVSITLSNKVLETTAALVVKLEAAAFVKARAYPTVFSPRRESVKIQYSLRENTDVTIRIYTVVMDLVKEMAIPSGSTGAVQGINTVEWNGKGGDNDTIGRSGGYRILIDKGYEKEWTGAVIKNY